MRHPIHQKIKRYILALIGIGLSGVSVMAQGDHMRFVGVVLNAESGKVLPEVNIFQNKRWVANTSHEGIFDMTIAISDSLVFSHLGFQDIALIVDSILIGDDIMVLTMKPEVKRLDSVTVIGKKKMETSTNSLSNTYISKGRLQLIIWQAFLTKSFLCYD